MYENSIRMLMRLCGILKALYVGVNFVDKHSSENFNLNNLLVEEIKKFMSNKDLALSRQRFLISTQIVKNAYDLLEYFNKHKLVIAEYEFDVTISLSEAVKLLIENALQTPKKEIKTEKGKFDV